MTGASGPSTRRLEIALVLAVSLLVLVATARVPQWIVGDAAQQLRAVQQFVAGRSPSLNQVVEPTEADLTRDDAAWMLWWPPGPQLVTYPWAALGLSLATSVRIVAALALVFGSLGWSAWFRRFDLPWQLRCGAAAVLPLVHTANETLFVFTQDVLNFAVAPWLLVMAAAIAGRGGVLRFFVAGVALGFTYVIKYSLVFVALGVLAFFAFEVSRRRQRLWPVVATTLGCAIPIATLTALNARHAGTMNTVAETAGLYLHWQSVVAIIANPILAIADADSLWRYLLLHPGHPITSDVLAPEYVGLLPGLVLLWLVGRAAFDPAITSRTATRLALAVFVVALAALFGIWTLSTAADYEARHLLPASLAILPVAYASAVSVWRRGGWVRRIVPAVVGFAFIAVPVVYGAVSVVGKLSRIPSTYRVGPSGFYNPLLGETDLAPVEQAILRRFQAQTDVWFATDAVTALDIPGRVWSDANLEFTPVERIATLRFETSAPVRITALLPAMFEAEGKGAAIRGMFPGAGAWQRWAVPPHGKYTVWTTVVSPKR